MNPEDNPAWIFATSPSSPSVSSATLSYGLRCTICSATAGEPALLPHPTTTRTMTTDTLAAAIAEAERFLAAARRLQQREGTKPAQFIWGSLESGSCRRASMDLTRALAVMRKGR